MYETLFAFGKSVYYIYSFSTYNQKIIISLYTVYDVSKFFYTIGNGVVFNRPKQPEPLVLEIDTVIDSELGEFEMITM
jgi:hypothetical protein